MLLVGLSFLLVMELFHHKIHAKLLEELTQRYPSDSAIMTVYDDYLTSRK